MEEHTIPIQFLPTPISLPTSIRTRVHRGPTPSTRHLKAIYPSYSPSTHSLTKTPESWTIQPKLSYKEQAATKDQDVRSLTKRMSALEKKFEESEKKFEESEKEKKEQEGHLQSEIDQLKSEARIVKRERMERRMIVNQLLEFELEDKLAQGLNDFLKLKHISDKDNKILKKGGNKSNYLPQGISQLVLSDTPPSPAILQILPLNIFDPIPPSKRAAYKSTSLKSPQITALSTFILDPQVNRMLLLVMMGCWAQRESRTPDRNAQSHKVPSIRCMETYFGKALVARGITEADTATVIAQASDFTMEKREEGSNQMVRESLWGESDFETISEGVEEGMGSGDVGIGGSGTAKPFTTGGGEGMQADGAGGSGPRKKARFD